MNVCVGDYTGPLDLLLSLIEKEHTSIYDVNICSIIDQYLALVHESSLDLSLETMSEFLLLASQLISIKSKMLLPSEEEAGEEMDPSEDLRAHLLEYQKFKRAAVLLQDLEKHAGISFYRSPSLPSLTKHSSYSQEDVHEVLREIPPHVLWYIYQSLLTKKQKRTRQISLSEDPVNYDEIRQEVLSYLDQNNTCHFRDLPYSNMGKMANIVSFLSVLELSSKGRIFLSQEDQNDDISIRNNPDPAPL